MKMATLRVESLDAKGPKAALQKRLCGYPCRGACSAAQH